MLAFAVCPHVTRQLREDPGRSHGNQADAEEGQVKGTQQLRGRLGGKHLRESRQQGGRGRNAETGDRMASARVAEYLIRRIAGQHSGGAGRCQHPGSVSHTPRR